MTPDAFEGTLIAPPFTGTLEDLGPFGNGKLMLILKLDDERAADDLGKVLGRRVTVLVIEEPPEPDDVPIVDGPTPDELKEMYEESKQPPIDPEGP